MRVRSTALITGLAALAAPVPARAAPQTMPLSEVRSGMRCTGYSVFRGQAIEPFDVEILDVVGEAATGTTQPRLLVRVSGEKVDVTGIGPGFSGSPVLCPGADGTPQNAGAISESIGDYGGKTVLATPIEQIVGTPVDAPRAKGSRRARRDAALLRRAKPLSAPITVGGLDPALMRGLAAAATRRGMTVLASPPVPADASPVTPLEPGSAVGVGLSSGDVTLSAIGTVAYVDEDNVWVFGHGFESVGARSLLLQDAYVATIVNNPLQVDGIATYKLAGAVHDVGTVTDDGFDAVAGRSGALPPTTRVSVLASDEDRDVQTRTRATVADETDVGNPGGVSPLSLVGPIAVSQGATDALGSAPQRLAGRMCMRVKLRELDQPLSFCNRYVSDGVGFGDSLTLNPVALSAGGDASLALSLFDQYKGPPVHVTDMTARISQTRAQRQGYLRAVKLPRRVRRGADVPAAIVFRVVRGPLKTVRFRWHVPRRLKLGKHKLDLRGSDPDSGFGFFEEIIIDLGGGGGYFDTEGPRSFKALAESFRSLRRWDGVVVKAKKRRLRFYRDPAYRIGGRARTKVRVLPRRG